LALRTTVHPTKQEASVLSVFAGEKATSVRLPTGGGKSLAVLLPGYVNYKKLLEEG
jgi:superfamily II DNA helicase RecQ